MRLEDLMEVKLTKRTDYQLIGREYAKAIEWLYDVDRYRSMCTFKVDDIWFYSVLVMNKGYLEPHFGRFIEGKFRKLVVALKTDDRKTLKNLIQDKNFIRKDGNADKDLNFIKILSYVFSFMSDYLEKKQNSDVKVMGEPRRFRIYKKLVKANLETMPYHIIDEIDDFYENKDGSRLAAKALILKYDFA